VRVRVADGPTQRIRDMGGQHMPGDEAWLIGERRSSGERKYYLSNRPIDTPIKALASTIKARWICEQAHQQLKEELGLDHFEGRSWHGLHRHALMAMIAYNLPSASPSRSREAGKKESTGHHHSQACQRCVTPSSLTSCGARISDVRMAQLGVAL
jgi:SRSO17 transposase